MTDADLPLAHKTIEPSADVEPPYPAVIVLHGRGADETDLLPIAQRLPEELFVLSLRAPDRLQGGYTWYALDVPDGDLHRSQPDPEEFRRSLDLVDECLDEAITAYELDPDRIGLLGFSQGAITSMTYLLERPERVAWVVALHGYLPESHEDRAPPEVAETPVFVGAGSGDRIIPAARAESAAVRLSEIGCSVTSRTYESAHGIGPEELSDVVEWVGERVGAD